ncbi:MAG: hypothetical protein NXI22_27100, partial [bacterium]|nr:hypothetical protein [bacterium]
IWFQSKSWAGFFKNLLKQAAPAAALVTIILGLTYVHETIYAHSKGWETFSEYNMLRAEYIDYHTIQYNEANKPVFDDAGWNETDFELFRGWFQLDDERYSLEKLRWISERASKIRQSRKYPSIASVIDAVFVQQKEVYYLTLILFIPFLFFDYRRFLWLVYPAFALCIIAICSAIIFALDRFPIHVYCGFFEYLFVVGCLLTTGGFLRYRGSLFHFSDRKLSLLYAMKRNQSGPLSFLKSAIQRLPERFQGWGRQIRLSWMSAMMFEFPVIQTLLVLFVVYVSTATAVRYQFNFSERVARYQTNTRNGLAGFQPTSDVLYVVFAMSYPLQHHNPYDNFKSIRNSRVIQLGTATRSPFTYNRMKEFGITDVYQAILEREDVKVIAHPNAVALFLVSAEQRLGKAYDAEVTEAYIIPHRRDNYTVRMEALNFTPKPSEDSGVSNP